MLEELWTPMLAVLLRILQNDILIKLLCLESRVVFIKLASFQREFVLIKNNLCYLLDVGCIKLWFVKKSIASA